MKAAPAGQGEGHQIEIGVSMQDLTLPAARDSRDELANRTDVLDKVGALRMLPGDLHVMTKHVAEFYEVDVDLIRYHVKAKRDELNTDGYRVISRSEFESEFGSISNLDPKVRSIALFPRRAAAGLSPRTRHKPGRDQS